MGKTLQKRAKDLSDAINRNREAALYGYGHAGSQVELLATALAEEKYITLAEAAEHCVCERFKTPGFDYGETHAKLGKPRIGARWRTVSDLAARTGGGRKDVYVKVD